MHLLTRVRSGLRWFVSDRRTGRIVLAQWPNAPLWIWLVARAAHAVTGMAQLVWVATVALVVWAAWEIWSGASPFRRVLGIVVLLAVCL